MSSVCVFVWSYGSGFISSIFSELNFALFAHEFVYYGDFVFNARMCTSYVMDAVCVYISDRCRFFAHD